MDIRWTKHIKDEEKRLKFRQYLLSNKELFDVLYKIVKEKDKDSRKKQIARGSFDVPAWSEYQAYENGYQKLANELITLIEPLTKGE